MKNFHSDYEEDEVDEWQYLQAKIDRRFNVIIFSIIFLSLFCMAMVIFMLPSHAEETFERVIIHCGESKSIDKNLANDYSEHPAWQGITAAGNMAQVSQSENSWTILLKKPNGVSCVVITGGLWETVKPEIEGKKS